VLLLIVIGLLVVITVILIAKNKVFVDNDCPDKEIMEKSFYSAAEFLCLCGNSVLHDSLVAPH